MRVSILKINNVRKSYGNNQVLKGINLNFEKPGIKALIGPNGSGKTTLFSIIVNLLKKDSGEILIQGMDHKDPKIFKKVSFLKDSSVLYGYLTGLDHLEFIAYAQGLPSSRIDEVCQKTGITNYVKKKVSTYSLGMKQHLLLAMVIMNKPKLMILDEPLNGLDPTAIIKTRGLLQELAEEGTAILLSSHTLTEVDYITSDILFLSKGKIINEDISVYKAIDYEFLLDKKSLGKAKTILSKEKNVTLKKDKLIYRTETTDIQKFITSLTAKGIEFKEINKRKIGAEERYRAIFAEELSTRETGEGDIG